MRWLEFTVTVPGIKPHEVDRVKLARDFESALERGTHYCCDVEPVAEPQVEATSMSEAAFRNLRPCRRLVVNAVSRRATRGSASQVEAAVDAAFEEAYAELAGRPFLDWLLDGGLEKLIALALKLLDLLT